jgi:Rrf2 family protein
MKISRTIVYALQATIALSEGRRNIPISCRQLAGGGKMPQRFLLQILRSLVAKGVLRSVIGATGGYYLARSPDQITLLQILDAFENPLTVPSIPELPGIAPMARKRLTACVAESAFAARQELEKITIDDLIRSSAQSTQILSGGFSSNLN